jgi:hypothetical protein
VIGWGRHVVCFLAVAVACSALPTSTLTAVQRFQLLKGACNSGDERAVKILLEAGADPNGNSDWATNFVGIRYKDEFVPPLATAAGLGHVSILQLLVKHGASINILDSKGAPPLLYAIEGQQFTAVQFLLEAGATLDDSEVIKAVEQCRTAEINHLFTLIRTGQTPVLLRSPARWLDDQSNDKIYLELIMRALENGDLEWISSQFLFPLRIIIGEKERQVSNQAEFLAAARPLFTDSLRREILQLCREPLFKSWRGCMVGNGQIWFSGYADSRNSPWVYRIAAFGGFAFQAASEIMGEESLDPESKSENPPAAVSARLIAAEHARTLTLLESLRPEVLVAAGLYRVRADDSRARIARKFSLSLAEIQDLNPEVDWSRLRAGAIIKIGASEKKPRN